MVTRPKHVAVTEYNIQASVELDGNPEPDLTTLQATTCYGDNFFFFFTLLSSGGRVCGLVVRVPGYRSRGPASIPGATRFP
jgi:hypothetical protein